MPRINQTAPPKTDDLVVGLTASCAQKLEAIWDMLDSIEGRSNWPVYTYEAMSEYFLSPPNPVAQGLLRHEIALENLWMRLHALSLALGDPAS